MYAAEQLNASVCDMRFVKPLDTALIQRMAAEHELLVTLEENSVAGGAGSAVLEWLAEQGITTPVLPLGLPDVFIDHGKHDALLDQAGLSAEKVLRRIQQRITPPHPQLSAGS